MFMRRWSSYWCSASLLQEQKTGKRNYIRIRSPDGKEADCLIEDSDREIEESSEREDKIYRYFQAHAHRVEEMT